MHEAITFFTYQLFSAGTCDLLCNLIHLKHSKVVVKNKHRLPNSMEYGLPLLLGQRESASNLLHLSLSS